MSTQFQWILTPLGLQCQLLKQDFTDFFVFYIMFS